MNDHTYNYDEQQPFAAAEFAENPEPRCPCVLLLDTSGSMQGDSIEELNRGLQMFREELFNDSLSMKRVEIAVITFGPVRVLQNFATADQFRPPRMEASGDTPLGAAVGHGLNLLKQRKGVLRSNGIKLFRPWIFLMTDGEPTDKWNHLPQVVRAGEENKSFSFFALGVHNANFEVLRQIALREPMKLSGVRFKEFFLWLSASLKNVSRSTPGDKVSIPDYKPYGWAEV
ncbi:MAG: VWA domain-containing protein [Pyrinomonadaceae bacterium]